MRKLCRPIGRVESGRGPVRFHRRFETIDFRIASIRFRPFDASRYDPRRVGFRTRPCGSVLGSIPLRIGLAHRSETLTDRPSPAGRTATDRCTARSRNSSETAAARRGPPPDEARGPVNDPERPTVLGAATLGAVPESSEACSRRSPVCARRKGS